MAEDTAAILQDRLTEYGLVRALSRQDISPELVRVLSIDEAARLLQRGMLYPGSTPKTAKKATKVKMAKKAKKAKKSHSDSPRKLGRTSVRQVQPNYWKRVKRELHLLICTNDQRYETLRRYIGKESKTTQIALVSTISASIGAYLGMAATVIGPFVTLGLMALLQVGRNAWCAG
jgi:hypothetical protein